MQENIIGKFVKYHSVAFPDQVWYGIVESEPSPNRYYVICIKAGNKNRLKVIGFQSVGYWQRKELEVLN